MMCKHHYMLSSLSSFNVSLPKSFLLNIIILPHHYNRPSGQEWYHIPQFYKKPLTFIYLHHLLNPTPINTPLLLSFFILLLLLLLPCFLQPPTEKPPRESSFSCFPCLPNLHLLHNFFTKHTTFNLPPSPCENRPLLLDWGRVFLWRQNLGPVPSFWIGTELPFVGRGKDRC